MTQIAFDQNIAEQLDRLYATQDVLRRRRLVRDALGPRQGEAVLDVGCGPGFYVAEIAEDVGPAGTVVGVDASPAMLAIAHHRCESYDNVRFEEANATSLPLDDACVDAVLSVQVLEYVEDVPSALSEIRRVLRPGGRVVLWDVDWTTVSWHAEDAELMDRVLRAWDDHLAHPALPRRLAHYLRTMGFADVRMEGHCFATAEADPQTYGGAIVPVLADFVAGRPSVGEADAAAWRAEQERLGRDRAFFCSVAQFCFTAVCA